MPPTRWTVVAVTALLIAGCSPGGEAPPITTPPSSVSPATITPTPISPASSVVEGSVEPSRSTTRSAEPTPSPSLPQKFYVSTPLIDGGAATVVARLHELSGLRPALKLDVSADEVTLTVLDRDKTARGYRWRDGVIETAQTDVQYLRQTTFWPTDFALENVHLIFDNAALLGTSTSGQVLQVVEYRPGNVFMSVTTTPETGTIFFRKDGSVFRSLNTTSVGDIREGIAEVTAGGRKVDSIGFSEQLGYNAELTTVENATERRSRMENRPTFYATRAGASSLEPFDPDLVDAASISRAIASHRAAGDCAVTIDNRFERVQPVVTYECGQKTFYSDLQGRDMTEQLR